MTPAYLRLIQSDRVNPPTRHALERRACVDLDLPAEGLCAHDFSILHAVVERLVPHDDAALLLRLTHVLSQHRLQSTGDGWRYADMPPDGEALRAGLAHLESSAFQEYGIAFEMLSTAQRDELLARVQRGAVTWPSFNARHWFDDLLGDTAEIYMSDPDTLERINFTGFAFLPRWQRVDLGSTQAWELPAR